MKEYVQAIIDYVEENIEATISIEEVETHLGFSRYYLHKVFYIYTGNSIMHYVRKRKMEYALDELVNNTYSVLDIAVKYGYSSERSFRRVFKKIFTFTPSIMRRHSYILPPKIILNEIGGIKMLDYLSDVQEVKMKEHYLIGVERVSNSPEGESIDFMQEFQLDNRLHPFTEIGSDISISQSETENGLRGYTQFLSIPYEEYVSIENNSVIKKRNIPSKFLKLTIKDPFSNPFERIPSGWKKVIDYMNENYTFNNEVSFPCFEEKIEMMDQTIMNLYVAVKKKEETTS